MKLIVEFDGDDIELFDQWREGPVVRSNIDDFRNQIRNYWKHGYPDGVPSDEINFCEHPKTGALMVSINYLYEDLIRTLDKDLS